MVGFKDTKALIERWNEKARKLTEEDVMELSIALSKASKAYRKSGKKKMSVEERCNRLVATFVKEGGRMPLSKVKMTTGTKHLSVVTARIRAMGYNLRLEHEFHGNRGVSFYVIEKVEKK